MVIHCKGGDMQVLCCISPLCSLDLDLDPPPPSLWLEGILEVLCVVGGGLPIPPTWHFSVKVFFRRRRIFFSNYRGRLEAPIKSARTVLPLPHSAHNIVLPPHWTKPLGRGPSTSLPDHTHPHPGPTAPASCNAVKHSCAAGWLICPRLALLLQLEVFWQF